MENVPHKFECAQKDYVDARLKSLELRVTERFEEIKNEASATLKSLDKRLESMNEFRAAISDQAATHITRDEYAMGHQRVIEDIKFLREARAQMEGKATTNSVLLGYVFTTISIIIACASALAQMIHTGK